MHKSRDNRGYDPNPDNMPSYIDYALVKRANGNLEIERCPITRDTADESMTMYEQKDGFIRWLDKETKDKVEKKLHEYFKSKYHNARPHDVRGWTPDD